MFRKQRLVDSRDLFTADAAGGVIHQALHVLRRRALAVGAAARMHEAERHRGAQVEFLAPDRVGGAQRAAHLGQRIGHCHALDFFKRHIGKIHSRCRRALRQGRNIQPVSLNQRLAQPGPVKPIVAVGWIVDGLKPRCGDNSGQFCPAPAQQGAQHGQPGSRHGSPRADSGQSGDPARPVEPQQQCFGLIVGMMRDGIKLQSICAILDITVGDLWKFKHGLDSGKTNLMTTLAETPASDAGTGSRVPEPDAPVWPGLLDGTLNLDIRLLSLKLLLTRMRDQMRVITDPEVRALKCYELQRFFVRYEKTLGHELSQIEKLG